MDVSQNQVLLAKNPYPLYELLRQSGRAHWSDDPRGWLIPHYADVVDVLRDPRLGVEPSGSPSGKSPADPQVETFLRQTLFFMNPPDHTRLRNSVRRAFTPNRARRLTPRIREIANELIDAAQVQSPFDLIADFAYPLSLRVIAELLGVPTDDLPLLKRWSDDLATLLVEPFKSEGAEERAAQSLREMRQYFDAVFAERRLEPREDLISQLVSLEEPNALNPDERFGLVSLVLIAGHETTTNLIGNAMLALLQDPDAMDFLVSEPSRVAKAIDELLRFDSPVQVAQRIAQQDCEVAGQQIREGDHLYALLGAANRDPSVFANPDRLDFTRKEVGHVAFGQGVHFCLGASLARLEGSIALETLLRRLPTINVDFEEPVRRQNLVLRGLESLPLRF